MSSDDGRGSHVDVRARRAARGARHVVGELEAHAAAHLERFDRMRDRRHRAERNRVLVVGAVIALVAAIIVGWMLPRRDAQPIIPVRPSDSGLIVFGRADTGLDQRSLFTISSDGSNERRLPVTYTDCGEWSPDGSRLHVTASEYPGAPLRPAVVNPDGSGFALFDTGAPEGLNLGCGDWSPDGTRLVLEGFGEPASLGGIYTVDAGDGSGITRLTHGADFVPQFAPDGSAVVFMRTGGPEDASALFVIGSDGSGLRRITAWGAASTSGSWAPDGTIVFGGRDALWTVRPDGTGLAHVDVDLGGTPYQPRWAPDGAAIVFGLGMDRQTDIYSVRPDGSGLTQLTNTPGVNEWWPDWNVG